MDDAALVQILARILADVRNVSRDLLRPELGVAGFDLIFLNVDGREHIVTHHLFVEQHGVLVVIAFPGHEADEGVLAEGDLAVAGRGAVGDDVVLLDMLTGADDRALIDAGALVGTGKLDHFIDIGLAVVVAAHHDGVRRGGNDGARRLGKHANAGVDARFVFHARADDRGLGLEQRHSLTLHVRAHQSAVGVIVFQKRDHGSCHGHDHLRRNVHVVDLFAGNLKELVAIARVDLRADKAAVLVERLVRLRHDEVVFHVRRHIHYFVGDLAGLLVDAAERRFHKAVFIDTGESSKIGDKADVRTFGRLDRAHTAIVAVVHVTHLKSSAVTGQTAGAEGRQTTLVRQLRQRVILIHELGQRRRTEELLDRRHNGTDVDERLRRDHIHVLTLQRHALADHALHAGEADAELVLQKLTHRADTAVAEVVDVVGRADVVTEAVEIVDGRQNVVHGDMIGHQLRSAGGDHFLQCVLVVAAGFENFAQHAVAHALADAAFGHVEIDILVNVDHAVGDDLDLALLTVLFHGDKRFAHAGIFHLQRAGAVDGLTRFRHQLAGVGVGDRAAERVPGKAVGKAELFVIFISADAGQIITAGIEEQPLKVLLRIFHRQRLAGTQLAVDLQQCFLGVLGRILFDGGVQTLVIAEKFDQLRIGGQSHRTCETGHRQLAVLVDADIEHIGRIRFIFQPGTAIGDHGRGEQLFAGRVIAHAVVHTGGTHELRHDDALGAVDDKSAAFGHEREIAHEHLGLLDLTGLLVEQTHTHMQRRGIGHIAFLALRHRIFRRIVQAIVNELQHQVAGVVRDRRHVVEDLFETFLQKPLV